MVPAQPDHLARLRAVLAAARRDYCQLQHLSREGLCGLQVRSHRRTLTLAVAPAVGELIHTALLEAARTQVQHWEDTLAQALLDAGRPVPTALQ